MASRSRSNAVAGDQATLGQRITDQLFVRVDTLIHDEDLCNLLTEVLRAGTGLDPRKVSIHISGGPPNATCEALPCNQNSLRNMLTSGTKILDALLFLALDNVDRGRFTVTGVNPGKCLPPEDIQRTFSACCFLYFRSDKLCIREGEVTPSIFSTLGLPTLTRDEFNRCLSDINPDQYPPQLLAGLDINGFDMRLKNSLQLGFAGLRQLQFIARTNPNSVARGSVLEHVATSRIFFSLVGEKGFHSSSRPTNFISTFQSVNHYLDKLICAAYLPQTVKSAVDARSLYCIPRPKEMNLGDPIFSSANLQRVGMCTPTLLGTPAWKVSMTLEEFGAKYDLFMRQLTEAPEGLLIVTAMNAHANDFGYVPKKRQRVHRRVAEPVAAGAIAGLDLLNPVVPDVEPETADEPA